MIQNSGIVENMDERCVSNEIKLPQEEEKKNKKKSWKKQLFTFIKLCAKFHVCDLHDLQLTTELRFRTTQTS